MKKSKMFDIKKGELSASALLWYAILIQGIHLIVFFYE